LDNSQANLTNDDTTLSALDRSTYDNLNIIFKNNITTEYSSLRNLQGALTNATLAQIQNQTNQTTSLLENEYFETQLTVIDQENSTVIFFADENFVSHEILDKALSREPGDLLRANLSFLHESQLQQREYFLTQETTTQTIFAEVYRANNSSYHFTVNSEHVNDLVIETATSLRSNFELGGDSGIISGQEVIRDHIKEEENSVRTLFSSLVGILLAQLNSASDSLQQTNNSLLTLLIHYSLASNWQVLPNTFQEGYISAIRSLTNNTVTYFSTAYGSNSVGNATSYFQLGEEAFDANNYRSAINYYRLAYTAATTNYA